MARNQTTEPETDDLDTLPEPTDVELRAIEADLQHVDLNDPDLTASFELVDLCGVDEFDDLTIYH